MTDKSVVPKGMKAWAGGDSAPADFDPSKPIMYPDGDLALEEDNGAPFYWQHDFDERGFHMAGNIIAYTPAPNPLSLETSDLDPITPEEDALANKAIVAMGWTRQSYDSAVRMVRVVVAESTKRICEYLLEEADDSMAYEKAFGRSELSEMGVMRAAYYRQAAAFIKSGQHLRIDRPRPNWSAHSIQSGGEGGEG